MNGIIKSPLFINWLSRQDSNIVKRVNATLLKMEGGNLGDHKQIDAELHGIT